MTFVTIGRRLMLGVERVNESGSAKDVLATIEDPFVRRAVKIAIHARRYMPFYVFTMVWALMLTVVPTIADQGGGDSTNVAGPASLLDGGGSRTVVDSAGNSVSSTDGTGVATTTDTGAVTAGGGSAKKVAAAAGGAAGAAAAAPPVKDSVAIAQQIGGVTRDGRECAPGVRQIPVSSYATQCVGAFTGANGAATYRGVSADKIRIVRRSFPDTANSQAADQIREQAGFASAEVAEQVRDVFIEYFNKNFELYGRSIEWVDYESQNGNSTEEAQSRGREGACADATQIVKELNAFAVNSGSGPFGYCAAERQLPVLQAGAYFPEKYYADNHPYLWGLVMECERISYQVAEYVGKRLLNRPAKWAGDPLMQRTNRKFGTYVPDNDEYQHCVKISEDGLKRDYGGTITSRYNYQLDLSRFPDQAAAGIVQFKAAGVTTIINACDPYSTIFLTQAASSQNYRPEWYIIGVALQDTDNVARLYDQNQVDGHLFGMSQLGPTGKLIGKNSEPGKVYKHITGKDIPEGTDGGYFGLVHVYNLMQSAGPNLTPQSIAAGSRVIPPGGAPEFAAGYWSFQDGPSGKLGAGDHTLIDDSREIFYVGSATGPDGKAGTYIETYGGRRFRNNEWPAEEPPVYPKS